MHVVSERRQMPTHLLNVAAILGLGCPCDVLDMKLKMSQQLRSFPT